MSGQLRGGVSVGFAILNALVGEIIVWQVTSGVFYMNLLITFIAK